MKTTWTRVKGFEVQVDVWIYGLHDRGVYAVDARAMYIADGRMTERHARAEYRGFCAAEFGGQEAAVSAAVARAVAKI